MMWSLSNHSKSSQNTHSRFFKNKVTNQDSTVVVVVGIGSHTQKVDPTKISVYGNSTDDPCNRDVVHPEGNRNLDESC